MSNEQHEKREEKELGADVAEGATARSAEATSVAPHDASTYVCWLIERYSGPELVYWTGRKGEQFSTDAQWAVRFSRSEDAEQVRCHVAEDGHACRSVAHVFLESDDNG